MDMALRAAACHSACVIITIEICRKSFLAPRILPGKDAFEIRYCRGNAISIQSLGQVFELFPYGRLGDGKAIKSGQTV